MTLASVARGGRLTATLQSCTNDRRTTATSKITASPPCLRILVTNGDYFKDPATPVRYGPTPDAGTPLESRERESFAEGVRIGPGSNTVGWGNGWPAIRTCRAVNRSDADDLRAVAAICGPTRRRVGAGNHAIHFDCPVRTKAVLTLALFGPRRA